MPSPPISSLFRLGNIFFALALTKMGITAILDPKSSAIGFGLPASTSETLAYQPVWGVRDVGFGGAIAWLTPLEATGFLNTGGRGAGVVTLIGSFVGLSDSVIVNSYGGQGAGAHALGASMMLITALGTLITSRS